MIKWIVDDTPACVGDIMDMETGEELCIQTDWDFPGAASLFGWSLQDVQQPDREEPCDHDGTDGTVDCGDCGLTASDFISAAYDWLKDNDGIEVDDTGYFSGKS